LGKDDPAHTGCCGIGGANGSDWRVNQFAQAGRTVVEIPYDPPHVIKEVMHMGSYADSLLRFVPESVLQKAE
jgi:hypothetical protein